MAIRNAAYPVTAATFLDKVDHVSPVIAADVNALQDELVATHTFVGVVGDLPPAGAASTTTVGVTPGGQEVLPRITSHIYMLNEWVKKFRDSAGSTDPVAIEALAKAGKALTAAGTAQTTAGTAQTTASEALKKAVGAREHATSAKDRADSAHIEMDTVIVPRIAAVERAVGAATGTAVDTGVYGHIWVNIPAKAYTKGYILMYGVSNEMWPGFTTSSPHTTADLLYPLTTWWDFGFGIPTRDKCWFYLTAKAAFTQPNGKLSNGDTQNRVRITYRAVNRVGTVQGLSLPVASAAPLFATPGESLPAGMGPAELLTGVHGEVFPLEVPTS